MATPTNGQQGTPSTAAGSKSIFASRTFWLNGLGLVALWATAHGYDWGLDEKTQLQLVGAIMVIINWIMRRLTSQPVHVIRKRE